MSVKIITSKEGNIFQPTKKEGLLCLAVEEIQAAKAVSLDGKFAGTQSRRIAFVFRTKEQFDQIFTAMNVKPTANAILPGIVVVKETLTPMSSVDPTRGMKYPNAAAKAQGLACTLNGQPVYRDTYYTSDIEEEDELIAHDNKDQISAFVANMNNAGAGLGNAVKANATKTRARA